MTTVWVTVWPDDLTWDAAGDGLPDGTIIDSRTHTAEQMEWWLNLLRKEPDITVWWRRFEDEEYHRELPQVAVKRVEQKMREARLREAFS